MSQLLSPLSLAVFAALGLLSLAMLTVALRKLAQFRKMGVGGGHKAEAALDLWLAGRVNEAVTAARTQKTVLGRILAGVISGLQARPGDTGFAEELGRQTALVELARMGRYMRFLDICVQSAPMLGLLGTVLGMIDAFATLSATQGMADPASLAGGIWTALTTTAAGLALALVASFITTWFESRIDQERIMAEALISAAIYGRVDPAHKG
ncbi:MotA/TolQ/ExbB proton channel family protein [Thioclava sp. FTW29]|uniref:MotA/TolQ/ExbB proton channel family protein n=1 Tax=Thioclava litoralis TaxID=3076557 RepID=A0ABZ1E317_9RHOB|nr:MotA/TolQ/ExbB proton channel family protein [Thioclava sp. FTW29]